MFTGLDVDKATISVAVAQGKRGGEVRHREQCRTVPIRFASSWRSWRPAGSGYILAMKQVLAATACTGNSSNLGMAAGHGRIVVAQHLAVHGERPGQSLPLNICALPGSHALRGVRKNAKINHLNRFGKT